MKSIVDIVPEDWNTKPLKSFSTTYSGGTPLRSNENNYLGTVNWVKSSELKEKYLYETEEHINEEAIKNSSARYIDSDAVLFAMYGATAGDICILKSQSTCNQAVLAIPINKEKIDLEYLFYFLKYKAEKLKYITQGGGQPNLSKGIIDKVPISYPSNPVEQTAIATLLSKVDEAISAAQNSIKAAEKLKKALVQNLLTGKLKPDGTWRKDDEFFEYEKFGKVPMGWEVKTIKQLFDFYPTSSYSRSILTDEGEVGNIHYGDIHTKFDRILDLSIESVPFIPTELEKKYEKLQDGDLVVADASEDWDGVGKSIEIINSNNKKVIAGLHTLHLRPKSNDLILGIKGYLMNLYNVSVSIKRMATGAKVYGINKSSLSKILLPIPSEPEQQAIKVKLDGVSNEIISKQTKIQTLQRLKKSLMQNLLSGKVRLPEKFITQFEKIEAETINS
jgi:type I restriction enzyme S subunit